MSEIRIDAEPLDVLRRRHSEKWRHFPDDVLPMFVAEMDYPIAEPIKRTLVDLVTNSDLGYLGAVPEIAPAFVDFAQRRWGWTPDTTHARLACDVGVATVEYLRANNATSVVITSPVYSGFWGWLRELDVEIVDVPLTDRFDLDFDGIERAFAAGAKHFLLCNPHNPIGRVFGREELLRLAALADSYDVTVISDEIHAPLTFPGTEFVPYLSLGPVAERTGVLVTSTSKSWNLAGLKAAFLLAHDDKAPTFEKLPFAMHYRASILGAFSMATAYSEGTPWLDATVETIIEARDHLEAELARVLPGAKLERVPDAGYLAWIDVSGLNLGEHPWERILAEARVALVAGTNHGSAYTNHVRINFATSHENITEALERIAAIC
jgi:cystathionine beta-lyase